MNLKQLGNKGLFLAKKHSPELLVGGGIVSILGGTVLAVKATRKVAEVQFKFQEMQVDINYIKDNRDNLKDGAVYTDQDYRKDITMMHIQRAKALGKVYFPAMLATGLGITMILSGHNIMRKRNVAVLAAFNGVDKAFDKYRERVVDELGEVADRKFRYGSQFDEVEVLDVDDKTGKSKKVKKTVESFDEGDPSMYAKYFDETNRNYQTNAEYNLFFLRSQQNYLNDKLKSRGHLFLNEVYEALGFEHTSAGAVVGWVIGEGNDNYVDLGIYNQGKNMHYIVEAQDKHEFVNGRRASILLDFNVDGSIWDLI